VDVYEPVARALAALHATPISSIDPAAAEGSELWAWTAATTWLDGARSCTTELERLASAGNSPRVDSLIKRAHAINLDSIGTKLDALRTHLAQHPALVTRCFCHNDLSNTNVHYDSASGTARLIDFEFGGVNMRGFDLATHLSHWAGGASDGLYDDMAHPSMPEQTRFLQCYAGTGVTTDAVPRLRTEMAAARPLAHVVWGLWALCALPSAVSQMQAGGGGGFSHIDYAERRLAAFEAVLPAAMALASEDSGDEQTGPWGKVGASRSQPTLPLKATARPSRTVSKLFRPDTLGGSVTEGTKW